MNKINGCVLGALMATSYVSGFSGSEQPPVDKEAYFDNLEHELLNKQSDISQKWVQLQKTLVNETENNERTEAQIELQKKWAKLHDEEDKAMIEWGKLSLKTKLADLIDAFKQENAANEIWGDKAPVKTSTIDNVTVHIDTLNSMVGIYADDVDEKGRPVLQWEMNAESGHIVETSRSKDGKQVQVVEKDSYVAGSHRQKNVNNPQLTGDLTTSNQENIINIDGEMKDIEIQRDIAFKIMLFFISFMLGAFGLVYWIYTQIESRRQEEVMKQVIKNKRQVSPQDLKQRPFLDFFVGQLDNEQMVINPYARHSGSVTPSQNSRRRVSSQSSGSALSQHSNVDTSSFGACNLAHLEYD